jgi:hypothetical protein
MKIEIITQDFSYVTQWSTNALQEHTLQTCIPAALPLIIDPHIVTSALLVKKLSFNVILVLFHYINKNSLKITYFTRSLIVLFGQ